MPKPQKNCLCKPSKMPFLESHMICLCNLFSLFSVTQPPYTAINIFPFWPFIRPCEFQSINSFRISGCLILLLHKHFQSPPLGRARRQGHFCICVPSVGQLLYLLTNSHFCINGGTNKLHLM